MVIRRGTHLQWISHSIPGLENSRGRPTPHPGGRVDGRSTGPTLACHLSQGKVLGWGAGVGVRVEQAPSPQQPYSADTRGPQKQRDSYCSSGLTGQRPATEGWLALFAGKYRDDSTSTKTEAADHSTILVFVIFPFCTCHFSIKTKLPISAKPSRRAVTNTCSSSGSDPRQR